VKYATVHADRGPPFRQGRHRLCECMHGALDFAFFHPNALPTVGFSANEGLRAWMRDVAPTVSPLFAPIQVTLVPGQVLYVICSIYALYMLYICSSFPFLCVPCRTPTRSTDDCTHW
jgi:hypothetical protein